MPTPGSAGSFAGVNPIPNMSALRYTTTVNGITLEAFCVNPDQRGPESQQTSYGAFQPASTPAVAAVRLGFPVNYMLSDTNYMVSNSSSYNSGYATRVGVAMLNPEFTTVTTENVGNLGFPSYQYSVINQIRTGSMSDWAWNNHVKFSSQVMPTEGLPLSQLSYSTPPAFQEVRNMSNEYELELEEGETTAGVTMRLMRFSHNNASNFLEVSSSGENLEGVSVQIGNYSFELNSRCSR